MTLEDRTRREEAIKVPDDARSLTENEGTPAEGAAESNFVPGQAAAETREREARQAEIEAQESVHPSWLRKKVIIPIALVAGLGAAGGTVAAVQAFSTQQSAPDKPDGDPIVVPGDTTDDEPNTSDNSGEDQPDAPEAPALPNRLLFGIEEADIAGYLGESQEAFLARPPEERVQLLMYYVQDLPQFAKDTYNTSHDIHDKLSGNIVTPENMTDQEILTMVNFYDRIAITQTNPSDGNFAIDPNAAKKIVAAEAIGGAQSEAYTISMAGVQSYIDFGGRAPSAISMAGSSAVAVPKLISSGERYKDTAGRLCAPMTIQQVLTGRILDVEYCVVISGNKGLWLPK